MKKEIKNAIYAMVEDVCNDLVTPGEAVDFICKLVEQERILAVHNTLPIGYTSEQDLRALKHGNLQPVIQKLAHGKHCVPLVIGECNE